MDATVIHLAQWNKKGVGVCRELNDGFAELAQEHPDRFIPCVHLPLSGGAEAIAELDRAAGMGFRAVALLSSEGGFTWPPRRSGPFSPGSPSWGSRF